MIKSEGCELKNMPVRPYKCYKFEDEEIRGGFNSVNGSSNLFIDVVKCQEPDKCKSDEEIEQTINNGVLFSMIIDSN